jgi:hypothetical protein
MATADNNYFYATWGDNLLSDAFFANQPDVRFAKIPVEAQDLDDTTSLIASPSLTVLSPETSPLQPSTLATASRRRREEAEDGPKVTELDRFFAAVRPAQQLSHSLRKHSAIKSLLDNALENPAQVDSL